MNTNIITHMVAEACADTNGEIHTYDACNRRLACCCGLALKIWSLQHMSFIPRLQIVSPLHLATNQTGGSIALTHREHILLDHTLYFNVGPGQ